MVAISPSPVRNCLNGRPDEVDPVVRILPFQQPSSRRRRLFSSNRIVADQASTKAGFDFRDFVSPNRALDQDAQLLAFGALWGGFVPPANGLNAEATNEPSQACSAQ